jgi:hypothetical protein
MADKPKITVYKVLASVLMLLLPLALIGWGMQGYDGEGAIGLGCIGLLLGVFGVTYQLFGKQATMQLLWLVTGAVMILSLCNRYG